MSQPPSVHVPILVDTGSPRVIFVPDLVDKLLSDDAITVTLSSYQNINMNINHLRSKTPTGIDCLLTLLLRDAQV